MRKRLKLHLSNYTVNVEGNAVAAAQDKGYHAYYADNITAIEIECRSKREARQIGRNFGKVKIVFE